VELFFILLLQDILTGRQPFVENWLLKSLITSYGKTWPKRNFGKYYEVSVIIASFAYPITT